MLVPCGLSVTSSSFVTPGSIKIRVINKPIALPLSYMPSKYTELHLEGMTGLEPVTLRGFVIVTKFTP